MDELPTSSDFANEAGEYESRPYIAEPVVERRSDRALPESKSYVVVNINSSQDRVVVWTAPAQDRASELARFANRVLAGEHDCEEELSSD